MLFINQNTVLTIYGYFCQKKSAKYALNHVTQSLYNVKHSCSSFKFININFSDEIIR